MSGYAAGVVFFRWPMDSETLVMWPEDALAAARNVDRANQAAKVESVEGGCVAVKCFDLFLSNPDSLSPRSAHFVIRSSLDMEYFLPDQKAPVHFAGPAAIEVTLPPYNGARNLHLGRAIIKDNAEFRMEERR
jgi:hypothetical protein